MVNGNYLAEIFCYTTINLLEQFSICKLKFNIIAYFVIRLLFIQAQIIKRINEMICNLC